jgi:hypothetical protein
MQVPEQNIKYICHGPRTLSVTHSGYLSSFKSSQRSKHPILSPTLRSTMDITMLVSEGPIATQSQIAGPAPTYLPTPAPHTPLEYWPSHGHDQIMVPQFYPQLCEGQSTSNDVILKPFLCIICVKGFARRCDYLRHGETKERDSSTSGRILT